MVAVSSSLDQKTLHLLALLQAATNHFGLAPLPAQVSPDGLRYFGGTFLPFKDDLPELLLGQERQLTASQSPPDTQAIVCQLDFVGPSELQRSFL